MNLRILLTAGLLVSVAACKQSNPAPVREAPITSETESSRIPVANAADGTAANTGNLVNGPQGTTGKK